MQCRRWLHAAAIPALCGRRTRLSSSRRQGDCVPLRRGPRASLVSVGTSAVSTTALINPQRCQSSSSVADKKYHCSLCGKGFRLEMAAKVHLQQVHQGQGSVLAGAGAEAEAESSSSPSSPPRSPPASATPFPTEPTLSPGLGAAVHSPSSYTPYRKQRPTPKPLNEPENDLSEVALKELLGVWDDIGVRRLGEAFIHSSMIVRVSAGVPRSTVDPPASPGVVGATASAETPDDTDGDAPRRPAYGQIPMYGQPLPASPSTAQPGGTTTVASPFATAMSPFAAAVNSPFAQAPSPFVDSTHEATSATAASPFLPSHAASPFLTADAAASTSAMASEPVPFGSFPSTAAPFSYSSPAAMGTPAPLAEPQIPCPTCGKAFSSHDGMRMHAKAKHDLDVPRDASGKHRGGRRSGGVPDLPPYVPSPVDIQMTAPFASMEAERRWDETVLRLHSASVNNILLVGRVSAVARVGDDRNQISVAVKSDNSDDTETFVVHCAAAMLPDGVGVGHDVCVQGSLRMRRSSDGDGGVTVYVPLIVVSEASGVIASVRSP